MRIAIIFLFITSFLFSGCFSIKDSRKYAVKKEYSDWQNYWTHHRRHRSLSAKEESELKAQATLLYNTLFAETDEFYKNKFSSKPADIIISDFSEVNECMKDHSAILGNFLKEKIETYRPEIEPLSYLEACNTLIKERSVGFEFDWVYNWTQVKSHTHKQVSLFNEQVEVVIPYLYKRVLDFKKTLNDPGQKLFINVQKLNSFVSSFSPNLYTSNLVLSKYKNELLHIDYMPCFEKSRKLLAQSKYAEALAACYECDLENDADNNPKYIYSESLKQLKDKIRTADDEDNYQQLALLLSYTLQLIDAYNLKINVPSKKIDAFFIKYRDNAVSNLVREGLNFCSKQDFTDADKCFDNAIKIAPENQKTSIQNKKIQCKHAISDVLEERIEKARDAHNYDLAIELEKKLEATDRRDSYDHSIQSLIAEKNIYEGWKAFNEGLAFRKEYKFDESLSKLTAAAGLIPGNDSIKYEIEETKFQKAKRLVTDAENMMSVFHDCRKAYDLIRKAQSIFIEIPRYSEMANTTETLLQKALSCAKKHIYISIKNSTNYNLELYNQSLLMSIREKVINTKENPFIELSNEERDADYILVFKIEDGKYYSNSQATSYNNYCSCRQNTWYRTGDPNTYYNFSYSIAQFTSYTQTASASLSVSIELYTKKNVAVKEEFATINSEQWKYEYWTSNHNITSISLCPTIPFAYWQSTTVSPRYLNVQNIGRSRTTFPSQEYLLSDELHRKFVSWINSVMDNINF